MGLPDRGLLADGSKYLWDCEKWEGGSMTPLCTAGYEGRTLDEFVQLLHDHAVEVVVDLRELPLSRKRGFSKGSLSEKLASEGVDYIHLRELGNPREYRKALKEGWDFDCFATEFRGFLETRGEALRRLGGVASSRKTCLICFEADPRRCHRSLVADFLAEADRQVEIVHLGHVL